MGALDSIDKQIPILVVDDFSTMRRIIKNCLKQLGFNNLADAESGPQALEKLKAQQYQLIVSDWNMPNMMGIDLLRAVRGDDKLKSIPFLMVTAEDHKANVSEVSKTKDSNYIVKPFTAEQLQTKLEAIFNKK